MIQGAYPLVTIAIPTYNRADSYLGCALESATNQTYGNVEVIVSDNCSTDSTEEVVRGFSAPCLRYFKHAENIGANGNFNFCVEQAKGDYFLLLPDDDLIDEDFVELCMEAANHRTDIGIIRTGTRTIDSNAAVLKEKLNPVVGLSTADFFLSWFRGETALYLCSTLLNTQRLKEIGGFHSKHQLFQDGIAEVQLAARFGRVDVRDVKASFRRHAATRTFAHKVSAWCEDSLMLLEIMCDLVPQDKAPLVEREGTRYFARVNYNFASSIKSPIERYATYLMIYKKFDRRYSPFRFFVYEKNIRRIRHLARRGRRVLARARMGSVERV
jgi:glycosyltransferase involved in cell wall biosynthesis